MTRTRTRARSAVSSNSSRPRSSVPPGWWTTCCCYRAPSSQSSSAARNRAQRFRDRPLGRMTTSRQRRFELSDIPAVTLVADPDRLAQALRNLIRNAIEHTAPPAGVIRLEVTQLPSGIVRFTVLDDGPGIEPEHIERVFERFTAPITHATASPAAPGWPGNRAGDRSRPRRPSQASTAPWGGAKLQLDIPRGRSAPPPDSRPPQESEPAHAEIART